MIDEWPLIQKKIPNFEAVFRPVVQLEDLELTEESEEDHILNTLSDNGSDGMEKIRLSREESEVFQLLDGKNTVADVIESTRLGEFHTCKALYDLLDRKIIEPFSTIKHPAKDAPVLMPIPEVAHAGIPLSVAYPILAVVVIALLLIGMSDPLRASFIPFFHSEDSLDLKSSINTTRMDQVDSAVMMYYHTQGKLPQTLSDLVKQKLLREQETLDPWSRPYLYELQGDGYMLSGYTREGKIDPASQFRRSVNPQASSQNSNQDTPVLQLQ